MPTALNLFGLRRLSRPASAALTPLLLLLACTASESTEHSEPADETARADAGAAVRPQADDAGALPDGSPEDDDAAIGAGDASAPEPVVAIPSEREALCARQADDAVRDVFCKGSHPTVTSLRELLLRLKLSALGPEEGDAPGPADVTSDAAPRTTVLLGLSTALAGHLVSPINPRAILLSDRTQVAFQRGVQKVEIISRDRRTSRLNMYLLSFAQACNERTEGCGPGDLYTLAIESSWTSIKLEDDEDLKNTPLDCRGCHQRGAEEPTLLMRELNAPWTHYFAPDEPNAPGDSEPAFSGGLLLRDYLAAKGEESYAGIRAASMGLTLGFTLESAIGLLQPLKFDGRTIEAELAEATAQGGPRRSPTWDAAFAAFKRGEQLALPHFEPRATDARKQAALSEAYARYRRGEISADDLPDLSDIFPDDPQVRAEIGLATEPEATASETLIQACGACHNDVLDQTISRARFNVALGRMSRADLDLAIARIELPASDSQVMPPVGARQLHPEGKRRLLAYLKQTQRTAAENAQLEAAAKIGMAKPPPPPPPR